MSNIELSPEAGAWNLDAIKVIAASYALDYRIKRLEIRIAKTEARIQALQIRMETLFLDYGIPITDEINFPITEAK